MCIYELAEKAWWDIPRLYMQYQLDEAAECILYPASAHRIAYAEFLISVTDVLELSLVLFFPQRKNLKIQLPSLRSKLLVG